MLIDLMIKLLNTHLQKSQNFVDFWVKLIDF